MPLQAGRHYLALSTVRPFPESPFFIPNLLADSARISRSATDRSLHMRTAQGLADEVNDALTHPMIRKPAYFTR